MQLNDILARFSTPKKLKYDSFQVKCPCHDDKTASLTITRDNDKILMKCHAGCDTKDIVKAIGLKMSDLDNSYKVVPSTEWWKDAFNVKPEAIYSYGEYIKVRLPGKKIFYGRLQGNKYIRGIGSCEKVLYKPENILKAKQNNNYIYICEGEKDADTLINRGYYATTAGGVNDWKKEFSQYFRGCKVVLLPDNDEPGQKFMREIKKDLKNYAFAIKTVITSTIDKGDVTDWFNEGNSNSDFTFLLERYSWECADFVYKNKEKININADILANHIDRVLPHILVYRPGIDVSDYYCYENGAYTKYSTVYKGLQVV